MDMQLTVQSTTNACFSGCTLLNIFLAVSAFILGRPNKEDRPNDVEAAAESGIKEDLNKAEVKSQI